MKKAPQEAKLDLLWVAFLDLPDEQQERFLARVKEFRRMLKRFERIRSTAFSKLPKRIDH